LDEIVIKQLTGGDTISARRLYSESEEFRPTFTPWIAGNHKPIVKGTDEAIWRRLRLIPFNVTIPHGERNPRLRQELMEEAPGILRWAIEGAAAWKEIGLQPPDEVLIATQSYRNEMDTVEPFLEAKTVREDRASVKASVLYAEYKRWSEESGEDAISKTAFGLRMGEKGYESFNRGGAQFRRGVRIRSGDDMLLPDDPASTNGTNNGSLTEGIHATVEPFEPRSPNW
jgi:putative DNA primase/helicase